MSLVNDTKENTLKKMEIDSNLSTSQILKEINIDDYGQA